MTPHRLQVTDNINLSVIQTDKFKSGLITFTVSQPYTKENIAYDMLLTSVLKRGTKKYPSISELNRRLDELYSSSLDIRSARIGKNLTLTISSDILDNRYIPDGTDVLDGALELVEEVIFRPKLDGGYFPESIVDQEKRFLTDSISSIVNNTRSYAVTRLGELMFSADREFPTIEELKKIVSEINKESLTEYHRKAFGQSALNVFYVGSLSAEELADRLKKRFSTWSVTVIKESIKPVAEPACKYRAVTEKMPVSQGKLSIGFKVGVTASDSDSSHYTAVVLNELFGGSAASKLFLNVREKLSLCYYCSSSYDRYTGTMTVSSGIENKNRDIAERAILSELNDIRDGKISDFELQAAKASLTNGYKQLADSPYDLQGFYGNREYFGFTENIEEAKNGILSVSKKDISRLAKKIVNDSLFYVEGTLGAEGEYE